MSYFSDDSENWENHGRLDFPEHLYSFIQQMREDETSHDVVFVVGNDRFPAHRCLVGVASPVLHKMLTNGMKETNEREVELKEVDATAWKIVLDYMYTGKMELTNAKEAMHVLECVERYQIDKLAEVITKYIERELNLSNCIEIFATADCLNSAQLRPAAKKIILDNFYQLLYEEGFMLLPLELVLEVINSDDLVIRSEFDVFVAVVRWFLGRTTCEEPGAPNSAMVSGANEELARKVLSVFVDHEFVDPSLTQISPLLFELGGLVVSNIDKHARLDELFDCVDVNKLSVEDLRRVSSLCRKLCKEARTIGNIEMLHVQKFSEKTIDKLVQLHNDVGESSVALYKRIPHSRREWDSGMYDPEEY